MTEAGLNKRDYVFHVQEVGYVRLEAIASRDPSVRADDFQEVELGPAELWKLGTAVGGEGNAPRQGPGWYICKYGPSEPRVFLRGCGDDDARLIAAEFAMEVPQLDLSPAGEACAAAESLSAWAARHPRKANEWSRGSNYGFWALAGATPGRSEQMVAGVRGGPGPGARTGAARRSTEDRPLAPSKHRAAQFREIASRIVRADRAGDPNLGQEIARALEAAYQRGGRAALLGEEPEPDRSSHLPWVEIAPRARGVFGTLCQSAFGKRGAERLTLEQAGNAILAPLDGGGWGMWCASPGSNQYRRWSDRSWSASSVLKLVDLGLLGETELADGEVCLEITAYGLETYREHLASGGSWKD